MPVSMQHDKIGPFVQFVGPDKRRRKIRLGGKADPADYVAYLNKLLEAVRRDTWVDTKLIAWVKRLQEREPAEYDKLASYGLVARREGTIIDEQPPEAPAVTTLKGWLDAHIATRTDAKPGTLVCFDQARTLALRYFGDDRDITTITRGDAKEFKIWAQRAGGRVKNEGDRDGGKLAISTVNRRCRLISQFLLAAEEKELIVKNPFKGVGGQVRANKKRQFFITLEMAEAVINACPNAEWRAIFALARFGGLRIPSELDGLRWTDINWERNRFLVHSPKTEHHEGGDCRIVPIFERLRPYLEDLHQLAGDGAEFVISKREGGNLRTTMLKIIKRAGLKPWPKVFQNLRSSRQTELLAETGGNIKAVCEWIGNTEKVALENYLQVTEADFAKAAGVALPASPAATAEPARVHFVGASGAISDGQACSADRGDSLGTEENPRSPAKNAIPSGEPSGRHRIRTCDPYRVKKVA
jgi:integrase